MRHTKTKLVIITLVSIAILVMSLFFVLKVLETYKDDFIIEGQEQLNGTFKTFYEDGIVKSLETFEKGKRNGLNIYYFPSACVKSLKNFNQGKLHGSSYFFSEQGDTVFIEHYNNDRLEKKDIINDSLYHFELNYIDYGTMVFNNNCRMCHEFKEDSLIEKSNRIITNIDSTLIDCGYIFIFHDTVESKDSLIQLSDSIQTFLNKDIEPSKLKDLNALKKIFENEINRPKLKYQRVKKIQKKVKVS